MNTEQLRHVKRKTKHTEWGRVGTVNIIIKEIVKDNKSNFFHLAPPHSPAIGPGKKQMIPNTAKNKTRLRVHVRARDKVRSE